MNQVLNSFVQLHEQVWLIIPSNYQLYIRTEMSVLFQYASRQLATYLCFPS